DGDLLGTFTLAGLVRLAGTSELFGKVRRQGRQIAPGEQFGVDDGLENPEHPLHRCFGLFRIADDRLFDYRFRVEGPDVVEHLFAVGSLLFVRAAGDLAPQLAYPLGGGVAHGELAELALDGLFVTLADAALPKRQIDDHAGDEDR